MSVDVLMVDRIVNLIEEGFDIAVRIGPLPSSGLVAVRVRQVRRVVCGAPGYFVHQGIPRDPAELAAHRIVAVAPVGASKEWRFGRGGERTVSVEPRLAVSSVAAAIEIARRGWGLCRALSYQIGPDLEAGSLQRVLEDYEPEPYRFTSFMARGAGPPRRSVALLNSPQSI